MCTSPECVIEPVAKRITTRIPGTDPVIVAMCRRCDTRHCPMCSLDVINPFARTCPNGHRL